MCDEADIGSMLLGSLVLFAAFGGRHHLPQLNDVLKPINHPRIGRHAITPRAAGFLIVRLDSFRQVEMCDEADVGFVDSHTEGDCRDDDYALFAEEARLIRGASLRR